MNINCPKRVALLGMALESNSFAPSATEADFRTRFYFEGEEILEEARKNHSVMPMEMSAFVRAMDATGPWEPVPIVLTGCQPSGPVEHTFFARTLDDMSVLLRQAGSLDGAYIANHGAMTSTESEDPDGEMFARVREVTGADTAIIATLDLHANISERMVESTDVLIAYLTNPHVDMYARGEEAAFAMRTIFAGARPKSAFIRLPLTPASVTLLSREGPYADLIDHGQRRQREYGGAILNVSLVGGFVFSDTSKNGLAIIVTGRDELAPANELAQEIAHRAWNDRQRFRKRLTSLDEAVQLARATGDKPELEPVIFSDAGDNPGGGGRGTTVWLLEALVDAGACGVLFGSFYEPELAAEAHALGAGESFDAVFNRSESSEYSQRYSVNAKVLALGDGDVVGRRGLFAGRALKLGPSCALSLGEHGGVIAVIISQRQQTADPMFFEMLGLAIENARVVCVKSRGHFRAGFDLWFSPEQVYEVDTPGLTAPVLERFEWRGLPRPVYPLDEDASWSGGDDS